MTFDVSKEWYCRTLTWITLLLLPFSWVFALMAAARRFLYRVRLLKAKSFSVPVIVVGNITAGGTGKTPFVIWLADFLRQQGFKPGIISRGVGGQRHVEPHLVSTSDTTSCVGDEAILLANKTQCPMAIGVNRAKTAEYLLQQANCTILISDDGLQHYRLARDLEIVLIDAIRRFGNGRLLPAGPLREPISRLQTADIVVVNGGNEKDLHTVSTTLNKVVSLKDKTRIFSLTDFSGQTVHAVAGIGHPERFFQMLAQVGIRVIPHIFPDHHRFVSADITFHDSLPVFMTEKDAVKCTDFADDHCYAVDLSVSVNARLQKVLLDKIVHWRHQKGENQC